MDNIVYHLQSISTSNNLREETITFFFIIIIIVIIFVNMRMRQSTHQSSTILKIKDGDGCEKTKKQTQLPDLNLVILLSVHAPHNFSVPDRE